MFVATLVVYLLPLVLMKYFHKAVSGNGWHLQGMYATNGVNMVIAGVVPQPKLRGNFLKSWTRKLWVLTTVDRVFWPVVLYPIYLVFGPWSIGYIVEDYVGVIFSWGIFIDGAFLPGSFTYAYGFVQVQLLQHL